MLFFVRNTRGVVALTFFFLPLLPLISIIVNRGEGLGGLVFFVILSWFVSFVLYLPDVFYLSRNFESMWSKWKACTDSKPQRLRMGRALEAKLTVKSMYTKFGFARFVGEQGVLYSTTLKDCKCPDFQKRKMPCKHMYKLACEMGMPLELLPEPLYDDKDYSVVR